MILHDCIQHGSWQPPLCSPCCNHSGESGGLTEYRNLPWDSAYCIGCCAMGLLPLLLSGGVYDGFFSAESLTKCHEHITWGQDKGEPAWHLCLCVCVVMCAVRRMCVSATEKKASRQKTEMKPTMADRQMSRQGPAESDMQIDRWTEN